MANNTNSLGLVRASNQTITTPNASDLNFGTGSFTVECWVQRASIGIFGGLIAKIDTDVAGYRFSFDNNDTLSFACFAASTSDSTSSTSTITSTSAWNHVAAVRNGATLTIFINTVADGTPGTDNARNVTNAGQPQSLGAYRSNALTTNLFDGLVDEQRIWNVARTQTQLAANWKTDVTGQAGLVSYLKLNNNLTESGVARTWTNNNAAAFSSTVPFSTYTTTGGIFLSNFM